MTFQGHWERLKKLSCDKQFLYFSFGNTVYWCIVSNLTTCCVFTIQRMLPWWSLLLPLCAFVRLSSASVVSAQDGTGSCFPHLNWRKFAAKVALSESDCLRLWWDSKLAKLRKLHLIDSLKVAWCLSQRILCATVIYQSLKAGPVSYVHTSSDMRNIILYWYLDASIPCNCCAKR